MMTLLYLKKRFLPPRAFVRFRHEPAPALCKRISGTSGTRVAQAATQETDGHRYFPPVLCAFGLSSSTSRAAWRYARSVPGRLRARNEWIFAGVLPQAAPGLSAAWWGLLLARGLLSPLLSVSMGMLIAAVQGGEPLTLPLALLGANFVLLQALPPMHQAVGANLGSQAASWLNDQLAITCVRPPGMGHLEDPTLTHRPDDGQGLRPGHHAVRRCTSRWTSSRTGSSSSSAGLGVRRCSRRGSRGGPRSLLAAAWAATHWLLRESGVWRDRNTDEVRAARSATRITRTGSRVDAPAAKELRLFGLADWVSIVSPRAAASCTTCSGRRRACASGLSLWSLLLVLAANLVVFWSLASAAAHGSLALAGS